MRRNAKIVAVTGASGFVGRIAVKSLKKAGYQVRALVRDPAKLNGRRFQGVEVIKGGLADDRALDRLCGGATAVLHLAGVIAAPSRQQFDTGNVEGTYRIASAASRHGVERFVHVSSLAAREPTLSDYGASKRASEDVLRANAGEMSWVIVRPPAVYGPGDKGTLPLIAQLSRSHAFIPGNAETRSSLIYVEDLASALSTLIGPDQPSGTIHELHDGKTGGYSWAELTALAASAQGAPVRAHFLPRTVMRVVASGAAAWCWFAGVPAMLNPGKVRELYHSDWIARRALLDQHSAWRPKVDFVEGFTRTLEWYREVGWLPADTLMTRSRKGSQGEWAA